MYWVSIERLQLIYFLQHCIKNEFSEKNATLERQATIGCKRINRSLIVTGLMDVSLTRVRE